MKIVSAILITVLLIFAGCQKEARLLKDYTKYVDPFIGTGGHGHTFPGAVMPYGMVQLSPDTRTETWDGCSGYHYSDSSIIGFSHTHYSGTGEGGGGDIMFMPTSGNLVLTEGDAGDAKTGYRSAFSHKNEYAEPGYYKVLLDDYNILVELTATMRVGLHKYTFRNKARQANIIIDLTHGISDDVDSLVLEINGRKISGYRSSKGSLAGHHTTYFAAEFSKPVNKIEIQKDGKRVESNHAKGQDIKAAFTFDMGADSVLLLKVGISMVDADGAEKNLRREAPDWDFDRVRKAAGVCWNRELNKIAVEGGKEKERRIFYTALYHAFIHPTVYMDVDRRYRSSDGKVYTADDFDDYTNFSLWDTFRGLHPLQTIINRKKTAEFIKNFIERYDRRGRMLVMEFSGNESMKMPPMIGYHSLSVIADAYAKGIRDYDVAKVYEAMKKLADDTAFVAKRLYLDYGFIPADLKGQSVSRTLEYAFEDWCVTRLAKELDREDRLKYAMRGGFYKNLFCREVNFMRGRQSNFQWVSHFDPMEDIYHYTEANAYQYTPFVPQDIYGLIELMGGDKNFEKWLDECFTTEADFSKIHARDVSGFIGQYAHGNEPSHHIAYLYNYAGAPWKTQKLIRQILRSLYDDKPEGMAGNEDAGQMSAWYVLSAMGFYSVTPGMPYYVIGSPLFDKVTINLESGRKFEITTQNNNADNMYIQSASLNGRAYNNCYINYSDIINGGKIVFEMGGIPNKTWAKDKKSRPYYDIDRPQFTAQPAMHFSSRQFLNQVGVTLSCPDEKAKIYYTIDGKEVTEASSLYKVPIVIDKTCVLKGRCYADGKNPGHQISVRFKKMALHNAQKVKGLLPGIQYIYREGLFPSAKSVKNYPPHKKGIMRNFSLDAVKDQRPFGYNFSGYIKVPRDGIYEFSIVANDGAVLYIDDDMVVDNDGGHRSQTLFGKIALKKGFHSMRLDYFQLGLAKSLKISWKGPGFKEQILPENVLFYKK